jgi:alpha-galactosidase
MASPLIFSGDMTKLDPFTINILCNAEVIDVDQDPLGRQAKILRKTNDEFVLAKPLEDGSVAIGLFNLTTQPRNITVSFRDIGVNGRRTVRDLWRQKNTGESVDSLNAQVGGHDVVMVRLVTPSKDAEQR